MKKSKTPGGGKVIKQKESEMLDDFIKPSYLPNPGTTGPGTRTGSEL